MKTLETKRCILRPVTLKDTNELFECYKQDVVVKYLPIKRHSSTRDTKKFIKSFFCITSIASLPLQRRYIRKRQNLILPPFYFLNRSMAQVSSAQLYCVIYSP